MVGSPNHKNKPPLKKGGFCVLMRADELEFTAFMPSPLGRVSPKGTGEVFNFPQRGRLWLVR